MHAENGEDQLQLLTEDYGDNVQAEEGEIESNLIQNARQVTWRQKCYGDHLQAEEGED